MPDFRLARLAIESATTVQDPGPQILLCTSGGVHVDDMKVGSGGAVFLPACSSTMNEGRGVVFVASTGELGAGKPHRRSGTRTLTVT